jgi:hypothetical protein
LSLVLVSAGLGSSPCPSWAAGLLYLDSGQDLGDARSFCTRLGDLDGDGDLDAFTTTMLLGNEVWINDGMAGFTSAGRILGHENALSMTVGDVDGDGDLDAVIGYLEGYGGTRVYFECSDQVAVPPVTPPGINRPRLRLDGPNPFHQSTRFSLVLPCAETIRVSLHDVLGRPLATVVDGFFGPGVLPLVLDGRGLPSGCYFLRMRAAASGVEDAAVLSLVR